MRRARRFVALAVLAVGGTAACAGVTLTPDDAAWSLHEEDGDEVAVWDGGDVEVVVPLRQSGDDDRVTADVLHHGQDVARLTVTGPPGSSSHVAVGSLSGGPPSYGRTWTEDVFPGRPVDVPPGAPGRPGAVRLALRPDTRWGPDDPPRSGARITLDLVVTTRLGSAACPFRFRVASSSADGWEGLTETGRALVVLLLAAATTAVVLWAG